MNNKTKRRTRLERVKTGSLKAGTHLISESKDRNMGMFVSINEGPGGKFSNTHFAPLDENKPSRPFRRKTSVRVGGARIETDE